MHVTTNKGIRKPRTTKDIPRPSFDGTENDIQWVEISGCQYANMSTRDLQSKMQNAI